MKMSQLNNDFDFDNSGAYRHMTELTSRYRSQQISKDELRDGLEQLQKFLNENNFVHILNIDTLIDQLDLGIAEYEHNLFNETTSDDPIEEESTLEMTDDNAGDYFNDNNLES